MSGIVGLLAADGVDAARLPEASKMGVDRGSLEFAVHTDTIALAALVKPGEPRTTSRIDGSNLVLDGRVDAVLRAHSGPNPSPDALRTLHEGIKRDGPGVLNDFAAEFAIALASVEPDEVLLARDAFGLRPLYFASRSRRFGFASDPAMLIGMGLASDELDPEVIAAYLSRRDPIDGRTAFRDIRAVLPGSWLRVAVDGTQSHGRWFEPDRLRGPRLAGEDAVDAIRKAVHDAIAARTTGRRVGIALSGGRDSGSLAIAIKRAGVEAMSFTQSFDPDLPVQEEEAARALSARLGFTCRRAPVSSCPDWASLQDVPRWSGTPATYFGFPQAVSVPDAASAEGIEVVILGEGGEPFFASGDVVVLDLLRTAHLREAIRAARTLRSTWGRPYTRQGKVAARAMLPWRLLLARERARPIPPWVPANVSVPLPEIAAIRSDRDAMVASLQNQHPDAYALDERLFLTRGVQPAYPLLDLRVVSVALSLDLLERAPTPVPKPLLAAAFLGDLAESRVKMSFVPYYERLARRMHTTYPDLFSPKSLACQRGLIDADGLSAKSDAPWLVDSLGIAMLELWLRRAV
jgi:asparagine synthase (glutamine-hydrolysing)